MIRYNKISQLGEKKPLLAYLWLIYVCKHRNLFKKKKRKRELGSVLGWVGRQLAPFLFSSGLFDMEMRPKLVIGNTIWIFHNMHEKNR